jgi:hypothetical protein
MVAMSAACTLLLSDLLNVLLDRGKSDWAAERLPDFRSCPNWLTAASSGLEFCELAADVAAELCPLGNYC